MSTTTLPARLTDPARSAAVYAVHYSITEYLEWIGDEVDDYIRRGHPVTLADLRNKLVLLADRIDALEQLGLPTSEAELHPELLT